MHVCFGAHTINTTTRALWGPRKAKVTARIDIYVLYAALSRLHIYFDCLRDLVGHMCCTPTAMGFSLRFNSGGNMKESTFGDYSGLLV